jgi:malate:Na+ symporter
MENSTEETVNRIQFAPFSPQTFPELGQTAKLKSQQPQFKPLGGSGLQRVPLEPIPPGESGLQAASIEPIPAGWPALMTMYIGIIPQPVYMVLLLIIIGFVMIGKLTTEISVIIAIMVLGSFTLGEIGKRLPILRDIGAPAMLALIVPSYLVFQHLLPTSLVKGVSSFFTSTNILNLFIAVMVVGGILSLERSVLIGGFIKVFAPVIAGTITAAIVGILVGMAFGLGISHTFFFIVVPIMGGGLGEGAIPLSIGYSQILHQSQQDLLAQVVPAVLVGNLVATVLAGLLNFIGKKAPELTGDGNLEPGKYDKSTASQDKSRLYVDPQHIAAVGITAITLYLLGNLCNDLFGISGLIIMIGIALALKLAYMISPDLQHGASHLQKFFSSVVALPILFAASIALIPWKQLLAGFALPNLVTGLAVVVTLMGTGFFVGRLVRLYPIESALINLCHGGMGGIGDVIILSAANRMKLMPFSQIATRIGGIIVVSLALLLLARFR